MSTLDLEAIERGFSAKAAVYDAYGEGHPVITWARGRVRAEVLRRAPPAGRVLELNAGTGADAAFLVEAGLHVHATDLAAGMVEQIAARARESAHPERFTVQQCSFTELKRVAGGPFDLVLSNFGGLNCLSLPGLRQVARALPGLLRPGGWVIWVVMPPFCPWEHAQVLRGQWRLAARRWRPGGVRAHVEGAHFQAYYFTPGQVQRAFPASFRLTGRQSLCLFCPPSFMDRFPHRFPRLTRQLMRLDERLGSRWPVNLGGDFVLLTLRHAPVL